jgi:aminotransferase
MMLNVFQPKLGKEELDAIAPVFESNWLGAGEKVEQFIAKFAEKIRVDKSRLLTLSSCTDGLFMAMELCEVEGYEVVLPTIHFVGAANAVIAARGTPVFCDVDPHALNPTVKDIDACVTSKTKAVCIIHYGGRPCDEIESIVRYCYSRNLLLIEDSACSLDSYYDSVACGTFGDIGLWSFDPMKLLSCGDGGLMFIRDENLMKRAKKLAFYGLTKKSGLLASETVQSRWWEFEVEEVGRYSSMNDIDAAIMLVQLDKLWAFQMHRAAIATVYDLCLSETEQLKICPHIQADSIHSHYFYWIQTPDRDKLAVFLKQNGIYTTFRYHPLHKVAYYGGTNNWLRNAEFAADITLLLPIHAGLTSKQATYVCDKINQFYK